MLHSNHIGDRPVNTLSTDSRHQFGDNAWMAGRTYLDTILRERGMTDVALGNLTGMSKQEIGRFVSGERWPKPTKARAIARALSLPDWTVLLQPELGKQGPSASKGRVVVGQVAPTISDTVDDPDELALLDLWRDLSLTKKAALFAQLTDDEMPSLRKAV